MARHGLPLASWSVSQSPSMPDRRSVLPSSLLPCLLSLTQKPTPERTTSQGPGCEGWHAVKGSRRRPGALVWSQAAPGNGSVEGRAAVATGQARSPRGAEYRRHRLGNQGRGKGPCFRHGTQRRWGGPIATRLGREPTKSGTGSEPLTVNPSRRRRGGFTGGTIKSGGKRDFGEPGGKAKPTLGHRESMPRRLRRLSPPGRKGC